MLLHCKKEAGHDAGTTAKANRPKKYLNYQYMALLCVSAAGSWRWRGMWGWYLNCVCVCTNLPALKWEVLETTCPVPCFDCPKVNIYYLHCEKSLFVLAFHQKIPFPGIENPAADTRKFFPPPIDLIYIPHGRNFSGPWKETFCIPKCRKSLPVPGMRHLHSSMP